MISINKKNKTNRATTAVSLYSLNVPIVNLKKREVIYATGVLAMIIPITLSLI
jgi:hypothetical protein